jgi:hypothetical protein
MSSFRAVSRLSSVLPRCRFSKGMEVHFSPEVETRLQQVVSANGKDAEQLVKDTVARMLENQARFASSLVCREASSKPTGASLSSTKTCSTASTGCFSREADSVDDRSVRPS